MLKIRDMVMIAAMLGAAGLTFGIKHQAEQKAEKITRLEREVRLEEETIELLKADWSLLNQPHRLQGLVERHGAELELVPVEPQQIIGAPDLPIKPVPMDSLPAGDDPDQTMTSSIKP